MKVVKSFIKPEYQDFLEKTLCGYEFEWHYDSSTVDYENLQANTFFDSKTVDTFQFTHLFAYHDKISSKYWQVISPLLFHMTASEGFSTSNVDRCKANLTLPQLHIPEDCYFPAHFDTQAEDHEKVITAIYYVNDSDGDTIFFKTPDSNNVSELEIVDRISPKKGTLVYFDSKTLHAGQTPRTSGKRCVINFNFLQ